MTPPFSTSYVVMCLWLVVVSIWANNTVKRYEYCAGWGNFLVTHLDRFLLNDMRAEEYIANNHRIFVEPYLEKCRGMHKLEIPKE